MSNDFLKEMISQGVKPIAQDKLKRVQSTENISSESLSNRRHAAEKKQPINDSLSHTYVKQLKPHDIVGSKKNGVQEGVFRKLRLGKYAIEARLDLHRHTVEEARKALSQFINDCIENELRTVLILHGKGDRDPVKKATIKSHVIHWLEELDTVMAYHSAQAFHGGAGAVYILLRKSDYSRQKNREKHGGR